VVERFANGVTLMQHTCPGLVQQIELGALEAPETRCILEDALLPMLEQNIDTVVLGCTHYPFVIPLIEQIVGENVRVIDPAPAVARQAERLLEARNLKNRNRNPGEVHFYTSGEVDAFVRLLPDLLGETGIAQQVAWQGDDKLVIVSGDKKG
jgi:glutamate racemase